jgi:PEP-CTERM motif
VNRTLKCMALVLGLGIVIGAHAAPPSLPACGASGTTVGNDGYVGCLGAFSGNMDNQLSTIWTAMSTAVGGWSSVARSYVSDESFAAAMNPFSQNEGAREDGMINFDAPQTGLFALGLKQGNGFSLYLFDGRRVTGGISSLAYDTNGVKTAARRSYGLSHAGYFGAVTPVSEPSAYAMMLAGLAVVGFALKRRKG